MTKRDPVTGMTNDELAALADSVREQAGDPSWEDVTVDVSPDVRSVVPVRFRRGELASIERAADAAGQLVASYIRWAATTAARLARAPRKSHASGSRARLVVQYDPTGGVVLHQATRGPLLATPDVLDDSPDVGMKE
jgi:hypothetical protein